MYAMKGCASDATAPGCRTGGTEKGALFVPGAAAMQQLTSGMQGNVAKVPGPHTRSAYHPPMPSPVLPEHMVLRAV
eukprot:245965-Rhodomonas_salina.1